MACLIHRQPGQPASMWEPWIIVMCATAREEERQHSSLHTQTKIGPRVSNVDFKDIKCSVKREDWIDLS